MMKAIVALLACFAGGASAQDEICQAAGLSGDASVVNVDDLLALLSAFGQTCAPPSPASATVSVFISHVEYANTGGDLFATIHGSAGSSPEVLITSGADARADYTVEVDTTGIGSFVSLDVRLTSNDGVNINEYEVIYGDTTYNWPIQQWHDGDSATNPPVRTMGLDTASTLLTTPATSTVTVTAVTGDVQYADTSNPQMIQIWGTNGYVAPMELTGFGAARAATDTIELSVPDIGEFVGAKITNTGNNGWHLSTLTITTSGTSSDFSGTWVYNVFLDGNGGVASPHADMFMASDATIPPSASEVVTTVTLQTSARDHAQTSGDITVTINGASGSSEPRVCASGGVDARTEAVCSINHLPLGELQSITVALTGNNGVHFNEIRAIYEGTSEMTWLFDTDTSHDGWLDGDSSSADILPSQDLLVAAANVALTGSGTTATIMTATGDVQHANTNSDILVTVYGANGHFGPVSLAGGASMTRGEVQTWTVDMADVGDLFAVKLLNTGNDGWYLEQLNIEIGGVETSWVYNQWIDGNGSSSSAPHSDFFYASEGLIIGSGMISTVVTLSTSFEDDADTGDNVYLQLIGTTGSSDEILAAGGIAARTDLDVQVLHGDIGQLTGVTVRLEGNNGLHLNEVRVFFAFGSDDVAHYTWLLTTITGWIDGPVDCNPCWPASRTFGVETASPAVENTGSHSVTLTTVTDTRNNAQSGSTFLITFFGSEGHTVPQTLSNGFENGATDTFTFEMGDIGHLNAIKITNTGNDGWRLLELSMDPNCVEPQTEAECAAAATAQGLALGGAGYDFVGSYSSGGCYSYSSGTYAGNTYWSPAGTGSVDPPKFRVCMDSDFIPMTWAYDKWIDGNGSSEGAPHADYFFWDGTTASDSASTFGITDMQMACPAEALPCFTDSTGVCPAEIAEVLGGTLAPESITSPLSGAMVTCLLTAMAGR